MSDLHPFAGWTDGRTNLLKELWSEGRSATEIAKKLGGITRNAVIGKVHRMGLAGRAVPSRPVSAHVVNRTKDITKVTQALKPRAIKAAPPARLLTSRPIAYRDDGPGICTILTIERGMCKWPIGDPADPSFTLCGRAAEASYCHDHAQVAYQPAPAKKPTGNELARSLRRYL